MWFQKEIRLKPHVRGFHLITEQVLQGLPELQRISVGLCHVFIKHTSASLTINENADPTVRQDFGEVALDPPGEVPGVVGAGDGVAETLDELAGGGLLTGRGAGDAHPGRIALLRPNFPAKCPGFN